MSEHIPDLRIEAVQHDGANLLRIEQIDGSGQSYIIDLHPLHVHHLAERLGIIDAAHRGAIEEVRALRRRMLLLRDRIDELDDIVRKSGIDRHADITELSTYSFATIQMANEFCADIPERIEEG